MKDKAGLILIALIEKLKKNPQFFGNVTHAETFRKRYAYSDVSMKIDGETEVYRFVVVKQAT